MNLSQADEKATKSKKHTQPYFLVRENNCLDFKKIFTVRCSKFKFKFGTIYKNFKTKEKLIPIGTDEYEEKFYFKNANNSISLPLISFDIQKVKDEKFLNFVPCDQIGLKSKSYYINQYNKRIYNGETTSNKKIKIDTNIEEDEYQKSLNSLILLRDILTKEVIKYLDFIDLLNLRLTHSIFRNNLSFNIYIPLEHILFEIDFKYDHTNNYKYFIVVNKRKTVLNDKYKLNYIKLLGFTNLLIKNFDFSLGQIPDFITEIERIGFYCIDTFLKNVSRKTGCIDYPQGIIYTDDCNLLIELVQFLKSNNDYLTHFKRKNFYLDVFSSSYLKDTIDFNFNYKIFLKNIHYFTSLGYDIETVHKIKRKTILEDIFKILEIEDIYELYEIMDSVTKQKITNFFLRYEKICTYRYLYIALNEEKDIEKYIKYITRISQKNIQDIDPNEFIYYLLVNNTPLYKISKFIEIYQKNSNKKNLHDINVIGSKILFKVILENYIESISCFYHDREIFDIISYDNNLFYDLLIFNFFKEISRVDNLKEFLNDEKIIYFFQTVWKPLFNDYEFLNFISTNSVLFSIIQIFLTNTPDENALIVYEFLEKNILDNIHFTILNEPCKKHVDIIYNFFRKDMNILQQKIFKFFIQNQFDFNLENENQETLLFFFISRRFHDSCYYFLDNLNETQLSNVFKYVNSHGKNIFHFMGMENDDYSFILYFQLYYKKYLKLEYLYHPDIEYGTSHGNFNGMYYLFKKMEKSVKTNST